MMRFKNEKAVFLIEYVLVLVAIIAGFIFMYNILCQRLFGRYKETTDSFGAGRQYEPYGQHKTVIR